jgi:hypothetical protein
MRRAARKRIDPVLWSQTTPPTLQQLIGYRLAPILGLHRELAGLVGIWPDNFFTGRTNGDLWRMPREIIFGLGDPWLVEQHTRRLDLKLRHAGDARAWLAHTGLTALNWLVESIRALPVSARPRLIEVLCLVRAPQAARPLLELQQTGDGCPVLNAWFQREVGNAVAGLLSVAAGRGKLADAARLPAPGEAARPQRYDRQPARPARAGRRAHSLRYPGQ